jgi:hypothetical protein
MPCHDREFHDMLGYNVDNCPCLENEPCDLSREPDGPAPSLEDIVLCGICLRRLTQRRRQKQNGGITDSDSEGEHEAEEQVEEHTKKKKLVTVGLNCGHLFCAPCLGPWAHKGTCPTCRSDSSRSILDQYSLIAQFSLGQPRRAATQPSPLRAPGRLDNFSRDHARAQGRRPRLGVADPLPGALFSGIRDQAI